MADPSSSPLPGALPNCRYCGRPLTKGFLQGESSRPFTPATIVWVDRQSGESIRLMDLGMTALAKSPRMPAFLCSECGAIQVPPDPNDKSEDADDPL